MKAIHLELVAKRTTALSRMGERLHGLVFPVSLVVNCVSFGIDHAGLIPSFHIPLVPVFGASALACSVSALIQSHDRQRLRKELDERDAQISALKIIEQRLLDVEAHYNKLDAAIAQSDAKRTKHIYSIVGRACEVLQCTATDDVMHHVGAIRLMQCIDSGIAANNEGIREYLRELCAILSIESAFPVAASIKSIVEWGGGDRELDGARLRTVYRDPATALPRGENDGLLYDIDANTATNVIFRDGEPYWLCNDLKEAAKKGEYRNSAEGWQGRYNATLVHSLPSMAEELGWRRNSVLCVDSLCGKFDDRCREHVDKIGNGVALLLYQNYVLDRAKAKLGPVVRGRNRQGFFQSLRRLW